MNREIKFRGLSIRTGEWVYGHLAYIDGAGAVIATKGGGESVFRTSVGQYTGIEDKNVEDIYEGDIIKLLQRDWPSQLDSYPDLSHGEYLDMIAHRLVVTFKNGSFVMAREMDAETYYQTFDYGGYKDIFEVIGNIHESPELLEAAS